VNHVNVKFQNLNAKAMSKPKARTFGHWGFGLDLAFEIVAAGTHFKFEDTR
jgi:hypothetical protein